MSPRHGAGTQTLVLWESSKRSSLFCHLSSPVSCHTFTNAGLGAVIQRPICKATDMQRGGHREGVCGNVPGAVRLGTVPLQTLQHVARPAPERSLPLGSVSAIWPWEHSTPTPSRWTRLCLTGWVSQMDAGQPPQRKHVRTACERGTAWRLSLLPHQPGPFLSVLLQTLTALTGL